jgi:hypothetical protein
MLAYLFWHVPSAGVEQRDYESALLAFQADLAGAPPRGFVTCATYRISEVPWLDNRRGYEDWYLVGSSAALDALNEAAIRPQRSDAHAAIASKMGPGHGGLYQHVFGDDQPLAGGRAVWMTRPRGIRHEPAPRSHQRGDGLSQLLATPDGSRPRRRVRHHRNGRAQSVAPQGMASAHRGANRSSL